MIGSPSTPNEMESQFTPNTAEPYFLRHSPRKKARVSAGGVWTAAAILVGHDPLRASLALQKIVPPLVGAKIVVLSTEGERASLDEASAAVTR